MFGLKKDIQYIIIIGCGELGAHLAGKLSEEENNVAIIDKDNNAFEKLPFYFGGLILNRDANDAGILIDIGVQKADTVIAVTGNDSLNMFVAKVAKDVYHVEHVFAGLCDPRRKEVYHELGIQTICSSDLWYDALKKEETI